jgi:hypothetical protein
MESNQTEIPNGVEAVEHQLPMTINYKKDKFYVRECYPKYYDFITSALNRKDYISLTGTPGIGKSIFYIYFFQRYRRENPNQTVVTAAFTGNRTLKKCAVFQPNNQEGVEMKGIPRIEGAIYFYDGPPDIKPEDKMVCFTSRKYEWLNEMIKEEYHLALYLPFWTLNELLEANDLLELGLREDVIKQRFFLFGGSARYCLSNDDLFVELEAIDLREQARSINSLREVRKVLEMNALCKSFVLHAVFHLVPTVSDRTPTVPESPADWWIHYPLFFKFEFCSKEIGRLVYDSITE